MSKFEKKISASIMCADLMNMEKDVKILEDMKIDYLHIDIMDNHFVPNITLSLDFVKALRKITDMPFDIHLMINDPEKTFDIPPILNQNDIVSIHYEATKHVLMALSKIKASGAKAGIALNPATPICMLENIQDYIDVVLIMTVNPGYASQALIPSTLKKISSVREMLDKNGYEHISIEVDGNVSFVNASKMAKMGADVFVCGTSSIFSNENTVYENCKKFRKIIEES